MLFNSFDFLLVFFPVVVFGYFFIGRANHLPLCLVWLSLASLIFHSYFKASYTWLFISSIVVNFLFGKILNGSFIRRYKRISFLRSCFFILGIIFNLTLLFYFKYALFISNIVWSVIGVKFNVGTTVLPLAISFYTFQQIAYLIDVYRGVEKNQYSFLQYFSYLSFFPHLVAGPIVRHDDLIKQISNKSVIQFRVGNVLTGLTTFYIGLFKKVVLADTASSYVDPIFLAVEHGQILTFLEAWTGAILFSFVIYFDFSGYSDMAIGLARIFNIHFPQNFASPYKSTNIIEFWKLWHITLSNFLRDYIYIPLGGNRCGILRSYVNIIVTMLIGGIWHGAGWNFIIWGGLHGGYLVINHLWRYFFTLPIWFARVITYLAVVVAWVFFRAPSLADGMSIVTSLTGLNGFSLPVFCRSYFQSKFCVGLFPHIDLPLSNIGISSLQPVIISICMLLIVWFLPNTQQYVSGNASNLKRFEHKITLYSLLYWQPTLFHITVIMVLAMYAMMRLEYIKSFIYFKF